MGMNAIKCETYAGAGKNGIGKEYRDSSDFDGSDVLKVAVLLGVGIFATGCIDSADERPPPAKVEYDKNASPITMGQIDYDKTNHFALNAGKGLLEHGQVIGLRRITENVSVSKDSPFDNICRVTEYWNEIGGPHYHLNCLTNPESDNIGIGDYVAAYKVVEVQK